MGAFVDRNQESSRDLTGWQPVRIRVPRTHGALLARPSLTEAERLVTSNLRTAEFGENVILQGRSLAQLREWTRSEILDRARRYTGRLRGENIPDHLVQQAAEGQLFVSGHQPSLHHPGVWVKNFAVSQLAALSENGRGLNLVVDNDLSAASSVRVPRGNLDAVHFDSESFDRTQPAQPWEELRVQDADCLRSFPDRITRAMADWSIVPLVQRLWQPCDDLLLESDSLCDVLTGLRHRLEADWLSSGMHAAPNWEVRLSDVCTSEPFLWFAAHLFAHAERFRNVHNDILQQYRLVNRVRSRTHPVPELEQTNGWTETPFWVWTQSDPVRRGVRCRRQGRQIQLSDDREIFCSMSISEDEDARCAVEMLRQLPDRGIRLRTRALTTTLFTRVFLADLFCHGIGGAKYDEMTDRICARFLGLSPPEFLTVSATFQLFPGHSSNSTIAEQQRILNRIRRLEFSADQHLTAENDDQLKQLLQTKKGLVAEQQRVDQLRASGQPVPAGGAERYRALRRLNTRLAVYTQLQRTDLGQRLTDLKQQQRRDQLLEDREYSMCLFPEADLKRFLTGLSNQRSENGER